MTFIPSSVISPRKTVRSFSRAQKAHQKSRVSIKSYATDPFPEVLGSKVTSIRNFESDKIEDAEKRPNSQGENVDV